MKKIILYPIISFIISFLTMLGLGFVEADLSMVVLGVGVLAVWFLLFMPISSFQYSKRVLRNYKNRIVYTLLHSLSICLSYLLLFFMEGETYFYALVVFIWCEIWGLIGLIGKRDKSKDEIPQEQ